MDLADLPRRPLTVGAPAAEIVARDVARALAEDIGAGDASAALIDADARGKAEVVARESMVLAGCAWFDACLRTLDPAARIDWRHRDGDRVDAGEVLCAVEANARALLSGERSALNFLQTLSGTATTTAAFVALTAGTATRLLDTRKTLPGLRYAQKYAVRVGGAHNHRLGLYDAVLIKENHIMAAGSIAAAVSAARAQGATVPVEVEVETLGELREALDAGADMALLDEFSLDDLRAAVAMNRGHPRGPIKLEASGNVTLETLRSIAETGVDFVSVGSLTKHVRAVDLSMRFQFG